MDNTGNLIKHHVYFEGKVQSLELTTEKGRATVGVMKAGSYEFSTSVPERMVVISGTLNVKLPELDWVAYHDTEEFNVQAGISFGVECSNDVAYICYYG